MENTVFINEKWGKQHLLMRDGEHDIYSLYMENDI